MKKRLVIISTSLTFLALFLMASFSIIFISKTNRDYNEKILSNLLIVLRNNFDSDDYNKSSEIITKVDARYRVSIISYDGKSLFDSTNEKDEGNYLNRPEIKNIGTISYRYSNTLKIRMMYKATFLVQDKLFLRLAIPESIVKKANTICALSLSGIAFLILSISFVLIYIFSKKLTKPLKAEISKLNALTGDRELILDDDISNLSKQIDDVSQLLDERIQLIDNEKNKLRWIINNLSAGIVVLKNEKVEIINKTALDIFKIKEEDAINKNYLFVFLDFTFSNNIQICLQEKKPIQFTYQKDSQTFEVRLTPNIINQETIIFIYDLTKELAFNKMKEDFFQNASHELKSPLTTIMGNTQMIEEKIIVDQDEIDEALKTINKEAKRMNSIISEMLDLAFLETTKQSKNSKSISIANSFKEILSSFSLDLKAKNIKLNLNIIQDFKVNMDQLDLYHLISNLVSNAIKYNKENGQIDITIDKNYFSILDSGIGIAKEDQERIFERFYRVDKAKSKKMGGTGLGLAIVKHIVSNYDLLLELKSELNKFTFIKVMWPFVKK